MADMRIVGFDASIWAAAIAREHVKSSVTQTQRRNKAYRLGQVLTVVLPAFLQQTKLTAHSELALAIQPLLNAVHRYHCDTARNCRSCKSYGTLTCRLVGKKLDGIELSQY